SSLHSEEGLGLASLSVIYATLILSSMFLPSVIIKKFGCKWTIVGSLYGILFEKHKEAAFANYRLWESLGFVIAFGYSTFLSVSIKLYILLTVLIVAMVLYGVVEYLESKMPSGTPHTANQEPITSQQNAQSTNL
ncbi:hypothetical protein E2320_019019, partial [Naja naja]